MTSHLRWEQPDATLRENVQFHVAYGIWRYLKKLKITTWKAVGGSLATNQTEAYRHLSTRGTCSLCGDKVEGSFYALVACGHVVLLWEQMRSVWPLPEKSLTECLGGLPGKCARHDYHAYLVYLAAPRRYCTWKGGSFHSSNNRVPS